MRSIRESLRSNSNAVAYPRHVTAFEEKWLDSVFVNERSFGRTVVYLAGQYDFSELANFTLNFRGNRCRIGKPRLSKSTSEITSLPFLSDPPKCLASGAPTRRPRGQGIEAARNRRSVEGFDAAGSPVWLALQARFGSGCAFPELRSVAAIACAFLGLALPRQAKRTLPALVQWFTANWEAVAPLLPLVSLVDASGAPVSFARELSERLGS
jgi:hypothetical protein